MSFDFIVIGSGLAGLVSALVLKDRGTVLLLSKSTLVDTATNLAQGGVCAVVRKDDSFESHIRDTLVAGAYHNNKKAVEYMVRNAPQAIEWLVAQGVRFEMKNRHFAPTLEAAHSHSRVLHATDFTGQEIERILVAKVRSEKNIQILENTFVLDLIVEKGKCLGVQMLNSITELEVFSKIVVLATGGLGQIYQWTTNPEVATGDGLAMAERAGVNLADLEFVQFHPTALKSASGRTGHGRSPLFLLSEALRGEGAYLIKTKNLELRTKNTQSKTKNQELSLRPEDIRPSSVEGLRPRGTRNIQGGERFMEKYDKRGELAPRDVVARAIFREQQNGYEIYLDIRHKGEEFIKKRFPNICKELKMRGFDLTRERVPVTPAVHYSCGGIKVDLYGRTNIKNLFAYGEVACTGAHGANRLASNSLLEATVFPLRLREIHFSVMLNSFQHPIEIPKQVRDDIKLRMPYYNNSDYQKIRSDLQKLMWEKVGIVRNMREMGEALAKIKEWERKLEEFKNCVNQDYIETKNMITVARLVTEAALKRRTSLGAHFVV